MQPTQRSRLLRIASGTGRAQQVFVVHGDRATRTRVQLGEVGADAVEVLEGLAEGDEVVISDMQDYERVKTVKLR